MAEGLAQTSPLELETPGLLGRALRACLGLATLGWLFLLLTEWRAALWVGELPVSHAGFWMLVAFALWGTSYVFNITFGLSWGQRTLIGVVAAAGLAGLVGLVTGGGFPNAVFGLYLWTWFAVLTGLLGPAHLLAASLGTPGCEMRSFAHAWTRIRGGDVGTVVCPGGVDRFDDVGRTDRQEVA